MEEIEEEVLQHYGTPRHSGRYPWGSGENPYQHTGDFLSRVKELEDQGLSEVDIAKAMGFKSTTSFRSERSLATQERRRLNVDRARSLKEDGLNTSEIAREMGVNESTVRSWFNEKSAARMNRSTQTAERLKEEIASKNVLDVGTSVERELDVSRKVLDDALTLMKDEGYLVRNVRVPQPTNPGQYTTIKTVSKPDVAYRDLYQDPSLIKSVGDYHTVDGGERWYKREYPQSISSDRVAIRYGDQGGSAKDGVIEIRRGVEDLNLGNSHYAQVRIMVDGTHYLKGMAMYSDDIPDGVDIVFNTNKKTGTPKIDADKGVLKPIQSDPDNPFGALIKAGGQSHYTGADGKDHLSAINKLKEEGDWDRSSKNLSSQFLSKQPEKLIRQQLDQTYKDYEAQYNEIMSLTNPTVKKKLLQDFADSCDSATIHLKASALPRQETRVILPVTQLKETEVYAPYLNDGEKVVLVRYPHAGTFEIPELTVNNKNPSAKKILGNATDAISINAKVAERLSGADFDGDTVIVIPVNDKVRVKTSKPLKGLEDFDPKTEYPYHEGMKVLTKKQTQREMGIVSNLITDMTLRGAPMEDLVKAVRHSMVVIDAAKHKLDYKQSEKDNDIALLKKTWQIRVDDDGNYKSGGASTLISRRKQTVQVPERKGSPRIDPETGKVYYHESGRTYTDAKGRTVEAKTKSPLLLETDDIRTLSSGSPAEEAYANYANRMKALANTARKSYLETPGLKYSPEAKKTYEPQVRSLLDKLDTAARNQPKERRATAIANSIIKAKIEEYPELTDKDNKKQLNKVRSIAMEDARAAVGASGKKTRIDIDDKEWEAIQMGAISDTRLQQILRYADPDKVKERALPKSATTLSAAKLSKLNAMQASGRYTIAQMAEALGVSTSTVSKYLNSK